MSAFLQPLNDLATVWFGQLWPILYQSAILAAVIYVITRFRRVPATMRFWLWMLVPLRLLVMPVLTVSLPVLPAVAMVAIEPASTTTWMAGTAGSTAIPPSAAVLPAPGPSLPPSVPIESAAENPGAVPTVPALLMILWPLGVVTVTSRIAVGWLRVRRIVVEDDGASEPTVDRAARRAAARLGLPGVPRIVLTPRRVSPFVHGVLRPVVVLPRDLVRRLSAGGLEAIVTHELAHVRRRDPLTGWILAVCHALYFFHPIFYLARHHLMLEREIACDESVLRAQRGTSAAAYARALISAALHCRGPRTRIASPTVLVESFGHLEDRVRRLAEGSRPDVRISRPLALLGLVFAITAMPGVNVTACSAPRAFPDSIPPVPARIVTVYVADAAGEPVAGAEVEVLADYRPVAGGRTGADGTAAVPVPEGSRVQWIHALKAGVGFDYFECPVPPTGLVEVLPPSLPVEEIPEWIDLTLDGARTVRIHAVDERERSVEDVRFAPWLITKRGKRYPVNLSGSDLAVASTDASGVAVFDWIPLRTWDEPGTTMLVRSTDRHWPDPPEDLYPGEKDVDVTARLLSNTTISGRVTYPDGRPAGGIHVQAEGRGDTVHFCRSRARTEADGSFVLEVFPEQSYIVSVIDESWSAQAVGIAARAGRPISGVTLALGKGALIHGTVRTSDGAAPVAGALIVLGQENPAIEENILGGEASSYWRKYERIGLQRRAFTGADGDFAFRVGPGDYAFIAMGASPGDVHGAKLISIEPGSTAEVRVEPRQGDGGRALAVTAAPVKAGREEIYDYVFHPAATNMRNDCMQCHRPRRDEGGSRVHSRTGGDDRR